MEPQLEDITGIPPRPKDKSTLPGLEAGIVGWEGYDDPKNPLLTG